MASQTVTIRLKPEASGDIRIPAQLARRAGISLDDEVILRVGASRLTLVSPLDPESLLDAFADRVMGNLAGVDADYRMSDGRTVEEYLALPEEQRDALWEEAFREAMDDLEKEPERDASADYVSAGQRRGARRVRGRGAPGRRPDTH